MTLLSKEKNFKRLGSRDRSGGYSRRIVANTLRDFVRPNWAVLLAMMVVPGTVGYVTTLFTRESERIKWFYIGITGISGFWLVLILLIIWTGIGNPLMGLDGENRTAEVLRKFRREGWELVNGMKLKGDWDIDHVLVGPAGVLVIESKWSHKVWPSDSNRKTYMSGRLKSAVSQVIDNREQFKSFFRKDLVGITVTSVCVLWSHTYESDEPTSFQTDGVVVIHGPALEDWMRSLTANWLDAKKIEKLSVILELQTAIQDQQDSEKSDSPLPAFGTLVRRNVLAPILGFTLAICGFSFLTRDQSLWLHGLTFALFVPVGIFLIKRVSLRRIGQGWLSACAGYFCVFVVALIQVFTR